MTISINFNDISAFSLVAIIWLAITGYLFYKERKLFKNRIINDISDEKKQPEPTVGFDQVVKDSISKYR